MTEFPVNFSKRSIIILKYFSLISSESFNPDAKGIKNIAEGTVSFDPEKQRDRMRGEFSLNHMMKRYEAVFFPEK